GPYDGNLSRIKEMNLTNRIYKKELLDSDNIPFADVKKNMQELGFINTWLGGHKINTKGLKELITDKKEITVCEIGCGGGDNLAAITKALHKNVSIKSIGIDIKPECIDYASQNRVNDYAAEWITSDYDKVSFTTKPDIIFSSLFCHHFTETELLAQLHWMRENSRIGFFINDLHRHPLAYYSIKLLTSIFSRSYLVKNDAPLSVARGFKKNEWKTIFANAGLTGYKIQWKWAFRYLILWKHECT
ncbi:MAG: methyltransferase domain-containing protein, partial [Panacibacter sp.]